MEILRSLGINGTLWIQLGCFIISYLALTQLILKPYMAALIERESRTVGNEETAVRIIEQANDLQHEYEKKTRQMNSEIRGVHDESRSMAMKEYDRLIAAAREAAGKELERARAHIATEIQAARKILSSETPMVSAAIATKLAGKDISI
jgi:F0F1-type ATP synthase membrane subunit b/b'